MGEYLIKVNWKYYSKIIQINIRQNKTENLVNGQHYYSFGGILRSYETGGLSGERYKFTGKERDTETNYDYFGARYYDSGLGRWLTPDPLSDKYPGWSPYNYGRNSPIRLIDPNGGYVVDGSSFIFMNEGEFNLNFPIWDNFGISLRRGETLFPDKTREVAADFVLSTIVGGAIKGANALFDLATFGALNTDYAEKHLQWEAEQDVVADIIAGKSQLCEMFNLPELDLFDKNCNYQRYGRGTVLNIDPNLITHSANKNNKVTSYARVKLDTEIKNKINEKRNKRYAKQTFDPYDVENGSPSR